MSQGSYTATNEHRDLASELARLQSQVELSWAREARLLDWIGLRDGMRVLDLGCGPGLVAERLLARYPALELTLLDSDPVLLQLAIGRLAGYPQVETHRASAYRTGLPDEQYDFVIARYLFQHLEHPLHAAREAARLLKPGGRLVIIDIDDMLWGIANPTFPDIVPLYAKGAAAQQARGGNRFVGRTLYRLLRDAGLHSVELEAFVYHSDEQGLAPFEPQISPDRLLVAVRRGHISQEEFAYAHHLHDKFMRAPDAFVLMVGLLAWGEKQPC